MCSFHNEPEVERASLQKKLCRWNTFDFPVKISKLLRFPETGSVFSPVNCFNWNGALVNLKYGKLLTVVTVVCTILLSTVSALPHHAHNPNGNGRTTGSNANANSNETHESQALILRPEHFSVPCGGVIHLFPRYGYFSLSMRVISKNERSNGTAVAQGAHGNNPIAKNDSWVFLEPVNNVIDPSTLKIEENTFSSKNENESLPFHNLYHFDLCEDVRELMVAYFKNFSIQGLDKPWQAFSGGWRVPSIARYFGIDQNYVEGDFRFILVKVFLVRNTGKVVPLENVTASPLYKPYFTRFKPGNELSSYEFFKIVHSYVTGNAIYQVFVLDPDGFQAVLKHLFYDGVKKPTNEDYLQKLPDVFTKYVRHYGRVFVLSSSPEKMDEVRRALITRPHGYYTAPVPSLFKLHNNSQLVAKIEEMLADEPHGILGIDLRGIDFLFEDPEKRSGFQTALKHRMQLWEINFQY